MKEKLIKRFSEYGNFIDDALGQLVGGIDGPAGLLVKKKEYQETWNSIMYFGDVLQEKFGRNWLDSQPAIAYQNEELLRLNLLRNKLFDGRKLEFEQMKQTWEPILWEWISKHYGKIQTDSRGINFQAGSGNTALVLLKSGRWHNMSAFHGVKLDMYTPIISVTNI